jgi:actin-related protein
MFVLRVRHRSELSRNILLIGATARLSGLSTRLQQEVDKLITTGTLCRPTQPATRHIH